MQTALQELIDELVEIKNTKCKTLQEVVFFDGVLAIIDAKYIKKEKDQIVAAYDQDLYGGLAGERKFESGTEYYQETFA